ncbi:MAG TPA: alkaline phosphatase family protein, partial [Candidatus Angelobacter sp.]|nr:alkaline phosphatase family protein [Candidatus Angelobacter sp.]
INSLAQQGALFTQSFAVEHPSQPNYLDLFSGSNQAVTDDSCPHTFSTENLASELGAAGLSFTGFSEDLPAAGSTVCTSGAYARKHAPWINFTNVATAANQPFTSFPTDLNTLPTLSFVIPNLNDDMHDGTIAQGDTWLQQNLSSYIQFAQTHNSLLIVTWDEDDNSSNNQIPTIFVGPMVKQGQFSETINHFNVLRTLEDLYGLTHVGSAASATPISDVWKQATPDFAVSAMPASLSVAQSSTGSSTISTTISGGFNSSVALSVSGLPSGVTASFSPSSIAAPGSGSSTLTFTASSSATAGTTNVTVTATGAGVTHTATIALTVTQPDFSVAASPTNVSVVQGSSATSTISTAVSGGFNSAVALSASGLPTGVTASFSPSSIAAPGSGSSTLTLSAGSTATTGTATVTVTATGGGVTHTAAITLTVTSAATPDFAVSASPSSVSVAQAGSSSSTVSTTVSGGFNAAVSLSASGLPSGVTASFSPASIAAPGSGSSTLTFSASSTATTGTSNVTVTATGGGVTHTTTIALTVTASGGTTTTQILGNPGFENGAANPSPWTVTTSVSTNRIINSTSTEPPHSGTFDAWLDGHGSTTTDSILQTVTIPANATAASLSFWLHIDTAETSTTTAFDTLTVQVRNTSGSVLSTLKTYSNLNHAAGYAQQTFDLSSFKGQTIQIFLQGKEDFELQTSFVVDDFALNVTTPGGGDTTPPTTSVTAPANGATVSGTVTVTATASDNVGVTQMQLLIDGSVVASNTNSTSISFSFVTTNFTNGAHTIVSKASDAAGNVGTSATVTVTVSNSSTTTELLGNGGFENGASNPSPWTLTSTHSPLEIINSSSSEPPHSGTFDAWLDGFGKTTTDTVMQQVAIPANATAATLSFWLHIDTAETSTTTAFDTLTVQVRNASGTVLSTLATFSNLNKASGYQQHSFDLSSFKGQTIQVFFKGAEDSELQTSFVLDDVSLKVTQ